MCKTILTVSMISFLAQIALNIPANLFAQYEYNGKMCVTEGNCEDCEMATITEPVEFDPQTGLPIVWIDTCAARGGGTAPANQPLYSSCMDTEVQEMQCQMTGDGATFSCSGVEFWSCDPIIVAGQSPECDNCTCGPEEQADLTGQTFTTQSGCV